MAMMTAHGVLEGNLLTPFECGFFSMIPGPGHEMRLL
jgi:hypothetical protein